MRYTIFLVLLGILLIIPNTTLGATPNLGIDYATNLEFSGSNEDPRDAIVNVVRYLLTFIALIAVIMIIYGVVSAVNAQGNESQYDRARKIIIAGLIGLFGILTAFVTVQFIIRTSSNVLVNGTP